MYALQERNNTCFSSNQTATHVGPTTYDTEPINYLCQHGKPFLVGSQRFPTFECDERGPYYPKPIECKTIGCGPLYRTARRFKYTLKKSCSCNLTQPKLICKSPRKKPGKLHVGKVPRLCPIPASIPTKIDRNGYDIDPTGRLIKCMPSCNELVTEVCDFNCEPTLCGLYRGTAWSRSRSKRVGFQYECDPDIPPPSCYFPKLGWGCCKFTDHGVRQARERCMIKRRFTDDIIRKAKLEDIPGPGAYTKIEKTCKKEKSYPFNKSNSRDLHKSSDNPGPGDYTPRRYSCKSYPKAPFLIRSERFIERCKSRHLPGPGSYDGTNDIWDNVLKEVQKSKAYVGGFNSGSCRQWTFYDRNALRGVAPNEYCVGRIDKRKNPAWSLKSSAPRFSNLEMDCESKLFDINPAYNRLKNKKSFKRKIPTEGFGISSKDRFKKVSDLTTGCAQLHSTPGPVCYNLNPETTCSMNKGISFPKARRFSHQRKDEIPGPNMYKVERFDSMHRAQHSFNVKLDNGKNKEGEKNKDELYLQRITGKGKSAPYVSLKRNKSVPSKNLQEPCSSVEVVETAQENVEIAQENVKIAQENVGTTQSEVVEVQPEQIFEVDS